MGSLTTYLQREFTRQCPPEWTSRSEVGLLAPELAHLLGYSPRADVLLERCDGARRLWIEFEVSRADPVANHAKFATAHLFQPQVPGDTFVAMVSPHVARGRRNLAASTVALMRHVGMSAFQTILFPHLSAAEIQRLNHSDLSSGVHLPAVQPELERALTVSEPILSAGAHKVHLVGDLLDVILNVRQWNEEQETAAEREYWGRRTVTYFVYDPHQHWFAPAKFCAYLPILVSRGHETVGAVNRPVMTTRLYTSLDGTDTRFDGHRAQTHLVRALAMRTLAGDAVPRRFISWLKHHEGAVQLHPSGPRILAPPPWFH